MKKQYYYIENNGLDDMDVFGPFATQRAAEQDAAKRILDLWVEGAGDLRAELPDTSFTLPITIVQTVRVVQPVLNSTIKLRDVTE